MMRDGGMGGSEFGVANGMVYACGTCVRGLHCFVLLISSLEFYKNSVET